MDPVSFFVFPSLPQFFFLPNDLLSAEGSEKQTEHATSAKGAAAGKFSEKKTFSSAQSSPHESADLRVGPLIGSLEDDLNYRIADAMYRSQG